MLELVVLITYIIRLSFKCRLWKHEEFQSFDIDVHHSFIYFTALYLLIQLITSNFILDYILKLNIHINKIAQISNLYSQSSVD